MMCGAVLMAVPALITGYITGRTLFSGPASAPQIFTWHWQRAVTTSVLATLTLLWRLKTRDQLSRAARGALMASLLVTVAFVATTGLSGRQNGLGDETAEAAPTRSATSTSRMNNVATRAKRNEYSQTHRQSMRNCGDRAKAIRGKPLSELPSHRRQRPNSGPDLTKVDSPARHQLHIEH
jgi:hypothetical protein